MPDEMNGWDSWGRHVLKELEQNDKAHSDIMKQLQDIHTDLAALKVKSGVWGAVGGVLLAFPMVLVSWWKSH